MFNEGYLVERERKYMKQFGILFFGIFLSSCQSVNYMGSDFFTSNTGNGFFVNQVNSILDQNATCCDSIEYKPYELLVSETKRFAQNQLLDNRQTELKLASLPKGGKIISTIRRSTIDAANTKYFTFILMDSDREILREEGYDRWPQIPSSGSDLWRNIHVTNLSDPFGEDLTIFIVDNVMRTRNEFKILRPSAKQYKEYQEYWNW
jgi:hypothetical protein